MAVVLDYLFRPRNYTYTDPISREKTASREAVVHRAAVVQEWVLLNQTAKAQAYPVNFTAVL